MSPAGTASRPVDVLIVSLGATEGLRRADQELQGSLERAGARVALARAAAPAEMRTLMLTDLAWARAARAAARSALAELEGSSPPVVVYSSTTAALLWPRPGVIRFDAPAAGNRPGRHGLWQRPLERRRLSEAPLLLPWSDGGLREAPVSFALQRAHALTVPVAVEPSGPLQSERDITAITYAANPRKKGLDHVLGAWRRARAACRLGTAEELVVAGASAEDLALAGFTPSAEDHVRIVGTLPAAEYRALVRRARVFVCAPRREDYGIAQLEALIDGCLLVSTPAPGPYAALPIARALDARLVSEDLEAALRVALADPPANYAPRARAALDRFRQHAVDQLVADELLPRMLATSQSKTETSEPESPA